MALYRTSLSKDFIFLALIVITTFLSLCVWFTYKTYSQQSSTILHTLEAQASRIITTFADAVDYTEQSMWHMNQQIVKSSTSTAFINKLLESYRVPNNEIVAYSTFSWADAVHKVVVTSNQGIMPEPSNISERDYIRQAMLMPWKIHLGQPVYGITSKKWAIPAGMGAVDSKGNYLGTIITGFVIDGVIKKLEAVINQPGVNFAIYDKDYILIAASHSIKSSSTDINTLKKKLEQLKEAAPNGDTLSIFSLFDKESQFSYYKIMPKYQYFVVTSYDRKLSQQVINQAIIAFIIESAVIAALIIVLLLIVRHLLVLPILSLTSTAEAIAKGKSDLIISHYKSYEMNLLSNQLAEIHSVRTDLSQAHKDLKTINESLEQRVSERTHSLQQALAAREDFFNHIGHEIRTPVSSIYARTALLLEMWARFDKQALKESIEDIQKNSLRVCDLVTSLLDLSKSRAGRLTYEMKPHDIIKIVAQVMEECAPLYERKGLSIRMENMAETSIVSCDAMRIGQVVRNLLSNACRYTAKGGVVVSVSNAEMQCDDGSMLPGILVAVKDSGIGIPADELTKIFEVFTQSSKTNAKAGGTGLGLAICLEIITAHHGHIWAENNEDGKGCRFNFIVPIGIS